MSLDESWRFAIIAFLVARIFYALWSWVILTIQPIAVHYIGSEDQPAVIFLNLNKAQSYAYLRQVHGDTLSFRSASNNTVLDLQTNSVWDIYTGTAIDGQYKGINLPTIVAPTDMFPYQSTKPYPNAWLSLWQRFDANIYMTISERGYGQIEEDTHFPPLYPMLINIIASIIGDSYLAGLLISHLALLYSLKLLHKVFSNWGNNSSGNRAIGYLLLYPASFFFFSVYTESLFLMTVLLSMGSMKNRSWAWAGFWTFCAILTRLSGMALMAPMLYLMWKDRPFLHKLQHWIALSLPGLAVLLYLYLRATQMPEGIFPIAEPSWHARLVLPWESYLYAVKIILSGHFNYIDLLNLITATLFIILLLSGWKNIPIEYNLYSAFSLLIILIRIVDTRAFNSMLRFSLALFPLFFALGLAGEDSRYRRIIVYTFAFLNLYLSAEFFGWGWVA